MKTTNEVSPVDPATDPAFPEPGSSREELLRLAEIASHKLLSLRSSLARLIASLRPHEFALLVDLVFAAAGYYRFRAAASGLPGRSMEYVCPVMGNRILLNVTPYANLTGFLEFTATCVNLASYDRYAFIVQRPDARLATHMPVNSRVSLWKPDALAETAIDAGLARWIILTVQAQSDLAVVAGKS